MILLMKNGSPFALRETPEAVRKLMDDIGGWNIWHCYDMDFVPPKIIVIPFGKGWNMSVTINVTVKRPTDRAVLVTYNDEDIWLPKSQIEGLIPAVGVTGDLTISDWIAGQKNLTTTVEERYIVEQLTGGVETWAVKDTNANPVHIMCVCSGARDANIIAASLEITKNKL